MFRVVLRCAGSAFGFAQDAQEVSSPDLGDVLRRITAADQPDSQGTWLACVLVSFNTAAMVEVSADPYMIDADAFHDVVDMVDHDVDGRRPERLADRGRKCLARSRIRQLRVEFVRLGIGGGKTCGAARLPDDFEFFRGREVDQIGRERRHVNDASGCSDAIDFAI